MKFYEFRLGHNYYRCNFFLRMKPCMENEKCYIIRDIIFISLDGLIRMKHVENAQKFGTSG